FNRNNINKNKKMIRLLIKFKHSAKTIVLAIFLM
ncbi:hypothetical protein QQ7_1254, partial [Clostridioides difficile Y307]